MNQKTALFTILLGTLAFSMSALPSFKSGAEGSRSLASREVGEVTETDDANDGLPDFQSDMHQSPDGSHRVFTTKVGDSVNMRTTVNVTKGTQDVVDYMSDHPDKGQKKILHIEATLETDCSTCQSGHKKETIKRDIDMADFSNLNNVLDRMIREHAQALAKPEIEAQAKAKELKDKQERVANCEDGSEAERLDCNVERMAKVDDVKAADTFEKKVRPLLTSMISSSEMSQRLKAKALLEKVKQNGAGGEYVHEQLNALEQVQKSKATGDASAVALASATTPQEKAKILQLMQANSLESQNYFTQLAKYNQNNPFLSGGTFDYTSAFGGDITAYQQQLDASFQSMIQASAKQLAIMGNAGPANFQFNPRMAAASQNLFNPASVGLNAAGTPVFNSTNMNVLPLTTLGN